MTKETTLNIRIEQSLKERARKAAAASHRSLASLIAMLLEEYCEAHEAKAERKKK